MSLELLHGRIAIDLPPDDPWLFANWPTDDGDGILCHDAEIRIPLRNPDETEPHFRDFHDDGGRSTMPSAYRLHIPRIAYRTPLVCLAARGHRNRYAAVAWTTKEMWDAAKADYIVVRTENNEEMEFKIEPGILDLSRRFPGSLWRPDGTIYDNGALTYKILRVYTDSKGEAYEVPPSADPRVPLDYLDVEHRNHSVLPHM